MTDSERLRHRRIAAFMQIAAEEERAAELIASLPRQSAFFQQQSVEKLVRAALEQAGVPAGPTHHLRTLTDLLPPDHGLKSAFLSFEDLSAAATRFRYPSGGGDAPNLSPEVVNARQLRIAELRRQVEIYLDARLPRRQD